MSPLHQAAESRKYSSAHIIHLVDLDDGIFAAFDITCRHLLGIGPLESLLPCIKSRPIPAPRPSKPVIPKSDATKILAAELGLSI